MLLLEKTNSDWWKAQRGSGQHGYVPANYVKEIDAKVLKKVIKTPVKEKVKVMVKKVGHRKELVKKGGKEGGVGKVGKGAVKEASKKSLLSKPASSLRRKPSGAVRCFCLVWCLVFLFVVWCCFVAWCGAVWLLCSVVEIPCFCVVSLNYIKTKNITPNNPPTPTQPQQPQQQHPHQLGRRTICTLTR